MKRFACQNCHNDVYFDSVKCVHCGYDLGYEPQSVRMLSTRTERFADDAGRPFRHCANAQHLACNWLLPEDDLEALCVSCRHNNIIPNLTEGTGLLLWCKLEGAKRALFYSLLRWGLPIPTKHEGPQTGLAFDFLADETLPDGTTKQHLTGHADGLITINIAEGDDAERERRRTQMGEPYRTLVGHFRHEVGHYYWDRLVRDGPDGTLQACRDLFGDDRADYAQALQRNYEVGPPQDWRERYISSYAASHPWEDFAETFAHYVHMVDGLETAAAFGIEVDRERLESDPYANGSADALIAAFVPVTLAINAVNRSIGQPDLYPFVVAPAVARKLAFVHELVRSERPA